MFLNNLISVCYLIPDGRAYRAKNEVKKNSLKWFVQSFIELCVYKIVVSVVVYSGIELLPQP